MSKKMLIDAGHPEETRVVIVDGPKVEEFDFEAAARKPLRGNIYLAKVTRVEPSLQAAFVEYGGNRHGFLAFNEIHPDYYQIPFEDRQALNEEEEAASKAEADDDDTGTPAPAAEAAPADEVVSDEAPEDSAASDEADASDDAETINSDDDDEFDEAKEARRRRQMYRKYKIQEVIKRRQILLVQVAKEERGNKGAALTTYLSLAGRYCVLMPNTPRGGGISRKISNASDRKRLKSVVSDLDLPKGVGLIIRTAGAKRTKTEIRRDADYLLRLWENIRQQTLKSVAPALIYEEGDLVKRAIRDLYDKEIESVLVQGDKAYKDAKAFIRMLMPSHATKVQPYKDPVPLYLRYQVEKQLEAIYSPVAPLKSGGYLVINPTEALVAIDVNSGRSTRERNIEATALKTNLEAAAEAARQMRLRDLAGLVVIDFIDMEESKNNRAIEKKMKDVLKKDRARLQMGRISQFGLMEISRQRRRTSILEGSTLECPTCGGTGHVRSVESSALVALRALEEEGLRGRAKQIRLIVPTPIALYLFNEKRDHLLEIESRFDMVVAISADDTLLPPDLQIEVTIARQPGEELQLDSAPIEPLPAESSSSSSSSSETSDDEPREGSGRRRRRRRRRGSGGSEAETSRDESEISADTDTETEAGDRPEDDASSEDGGSRRRRRRGRRGGRGRRRSSETNEAMDTVEAGAEPTDEDSAPSEESQPFELIDTAPGEDDAQSGESSVEGASDASSEDEAPKPKRRRSRRRKKSDTVTEEASSEETSGEASDTEVAASEDTVDDASVQTDDNTTEESAADPAQADAAQEDAPKPKRRRTRRKKTDTEAAAEISETSTESEGSAEAEVIAEPDTAAEEAPKPKRRRAPRKKKTETVETVADADTAESVATDTPAEIVETSVAAVETTPESADTGSAEVHAATDTVDTQVEAATPAETDADVEPETQAEPVAEAPAEAEDDKPAKPRRKGWWNRTGLFGG